MKAKNITRRFTTKLLTRKLEGYEKPTIWFNFSKLANQTNSINLGQGFPDWNSPDFYLESLKKYMSDPNVNHQYTRSFGSVKLVESITRNYSEAFKRKIDPLSEILVSNGAVALLYNAITALIQEGDEAILIEPFYDCYLPQIKFSGGKVVGVPMHAPKLRSKKEYENLSNTNIKDEWKIDFNALKKALNHKTKLLVLNTPNNPTGKVLSEEELKEIASILKEFPNVIVIMDEVYEHMVYDNYQSLPRMSNIPGMWDRTISIMSAGKNFSATGCRIGWAIGPQRLISHMNAVHQFNAFCLYDPLQSAIADSLDLATKSYKGYDNYYKWLRAHYTEHRNYFVERLAKINNFNLKFWLPEGSYFVIADLGDKPIDTKYSFELNSKEKHPKDFNYLLNLANEKKVVAIPMSPFFTDVNKEYGANFIRLAFCKQKQTLDKALDNLSK